MKKLESLRTHEIFHPQIGGQCFQADAEQIAILFSQVQIKIFVFVGLRIVPSGKKYFEKWWEECWREGIMEAFEMIIHDSDLLSNMVAQIDCGT